MNQQENKLIVINGTSGFPSLLSEEQKEYIKENIDKKTLSRLKQKLAAATAIAESFNIEIRDCLGEAAIAYIGTSMNNVIGLIEHEAGTKIQDMDTEVDFKNSVIRALLDITFEINEEMSAIAEAEAEVGFTTEAEHYVDTEQYNFPKNNVVYLTDSNIGVIENLLNQNIISKTSNLEVCKELKKRFYALSDKDRQEETAEAFMYLNFWRDNERKAKDQLRKLESAKRNLRASRYPM